MSGGTSRRGFGIDPMTLLRHFGLFTRAIVEANRFERLFMLSDHDLAARGTDRQRLVHGYLHDHGAA